MNTLISRSAAAACALAALCATTVVGQQTRLTEGQIRSAEAEIPELVKLLALQPGMSVADVGAGFGAWTVRFAKVVGPKGRVYATDVGTTQLNAIREYVAKEGLTNVTVIEGAVASTNLPAECCDAILVRDAFHHFTQPEPMIKSLAAALKPGGRLAIVDFPPRPNSAIPEGVPANRVGHGVPPSIVEQEVGAVLTHVQTLPKWGEKSEPASLFLVLFRK
jgi:cyclopropane fatty-acyl-phospholipid synthase-like methyltransferase